MQTTCYWQKALMARRYLLACCLLLFTLALGAAWVFLPWVFSPHYTLQVASGPTGSDAQAFVAAFKRQLAEERPRLRLEVVQGDTVQASAEAFLNGRADLAVVRSDHRAAASGGSLAIVRRQIVLLLTTHKSRINSADDLAGKTVAVPEGADKDDPLIRAVCSHYGLSAEALVSLPIGELGKALKEGRVAAVMTLAGVGAGSSSAVLGALAQALKEPPVMLSVDTQAIVAKNPVYEVFAVAPGALSTKPLVPSKEVETVAVTLRLVARSSMLENVAAEMTRLLFVTRARVAATLPGAGQIEAPDTDRSSVLTVHPGAVRYLEGSMPSFFEQAIEQLFNFSIIGGVLGSSVIFFGNLWRRRRQSKVRLLVDRLSAILPEARTAPPEQLKALEEEVDRLVAALLVSALREEIDQGKAMAITLLANEIRGLITRRGVGADCGSGDMRLHQLHESAGSA